MFHGLHTGRRFAAAAADSQNDTAGSDGLPVVHTSGNCPHLKRQAHHPFVSHDSSLRTAIPAGASHTEIAIVQHTQRIVRNCGDKPISFLLVARSGKACPCLQGQADVTVSGSEALQGSSVPCKAAVGRILACPRPASPRQAVAGGGLQVQGQERRQGSCCLAGTAGCRDLPVFSRWSLSSLFSV